MILPFFIGWSVADSVRSSVKIPVRRVPLDAMKEAVKMQAHEVWLPTGVLARRSQVSPLEPSVVETIYSSTGMVFEGWSKKVGSYFLPGKFKLLCIFQDEFKKYIMFTIF